MHVSAIYSASQWAQPMGMAMMANRHYLRHLWTVPNNSKHIQAILSLVSTDWLRLRIAQIPRCWRSGDFCGDNNNRQTATLPLNVHACEVVKNIALCVSTLYSDFIVIAHDGSKFYLNYTTDSRLPDRFNSYWVIAKKLHLISTCS